MEIKKNVMRLENLRLVGENRDLQSRLTAAHKIMVSLEREVEDLAHENVRLRRWNRRWKAATRHYRLALRTVIRVRRERTDALLPVGANHPHQTEGC